MPDEPNLTVYLWSEEAGKWNDPVVVEAPRRVFTARSLHDALGKLIETHHHLADLPVHLLDMESESDYPYGGLLTDIETDIFDVDQGMVLALGSWPSKDHARAAADRPVPGSTRGDAPCQALPDASTRRDSNE